jgi:hypothetical protein
LLWGLLVQDLCTLNFPFFSWPSRIVQTHQW